MRTNTRRWARFAAAAAFVLVFGQGLWAQLDPLIGLKTVPPNVVVVMDTSFRMLDDGAGNYYDVKTYKRTDDTQVANALGVPSGNSSYRRIYQGLLFETAMTPSTRPRVAARRTEAVPKRLTRRVNASPPTATPSRAIRAAEVAQSRLVVRPYTVVAAGSETCPATSTA